MSDIIQLHANLGSSRPSEHEAKQNPPLPAEEEIQSGSASWMHWRLVNLIADFEAELDDAHEVGIQLANAGGASPIRVETITYWNPDLIVIVGTDKDGSPVNYAHHVSSVNYALIALRAANDKPVRIAEALRASIVSE